MRNILAVVLIGVFTQFAGGQTPPQNNTVYEVFVRSFYDADNDKIGDLKGLTAKLDYLNDGDPATDTDLEIGILWLMPIFPSPSYHGYDVTDYRSINPAYGTLNDFKDLLQKAHARGMRVILDIPFNHTSPNHPWFKEAVENQAGRREWYLMWPENNTVSKPWHKTQDSNGNSLKYLGVFDGNMPDLNFDRPEVRAEAKAIAKFWLDLGVDGFRLDAAKHIYGWNMDATAEEQDKNDGWWREFTDYVLSQKPDAVVVGEVLGDHQLLVQYAWGLNALIDEPYMNDARRKLISPDNGFIGGFKWFVNEGEKQNAVSPFDSFPYLASHDRNPRLASDLEHHRPQDAAALQRMGMCLLLSSGKFPILYNGDEIGQRGWKWNGDDGTGMWDETLREPMPWFASGSGAGQTKWKSDLPRFDQANDGVSVEEQQNGDSLLKVVRALTNLRTKVPALADGAIGEIFTDTAEWWAFERTKGSDVCLVLINQTGNPMEYKFTPTSHPEYRNSRLLFWSDGKSGKWADLVTGGDKIQDSALVGPFGMVVLKRP